MVILSTNSFLSGESTAEAAQERQRVGLGAAAGGEGGLRGLSGGALGHGAAAAEAGARARGVAEAAAVARRPRAALGDGGRRQGGRVARGRKRGSAGNGILILTTLIAFDPANK